MTRMPDGAGGGGTRNLPERPGPEDGPLVETGFLARVEEIAAGFFRESRGSHDWDHTRRVLCLCGRIGPPEGADMAVLRAAALLHDIGRALQDVGSGTICHAAKGAELAGPVVRGLPLSETRKANILHSIRAHRYRGDRIPATTEARVLFDADKLDAIGAVGVARAYLFAGEIGARLHAPEVDVAETRAYSREDTGYREFRVKLSRVRDRMLTPTGRRMARERHAFMETFFRRFLEEYEGRR